MSKLLNIYYNVPISLLTLLKLKIKHFQLKKMTKKEKLLDLNLTESSEVKNLDFISYFVLIRILKTSG